MTIKQRLNKMTPIQKTIIFKMLYKINDCEGDMPREYWCDTCITLWKRIRELTVRFERMNTNRIHPYEWNFTPPNTDGYFN